MHAQSFWMYSPAIVLWGFLCAIVWHDVRSRRIPNRLVFSGAMVGVLLNSIPFHIDGLLLPVVQPAGLLMALAGLALGLVLLMPMYMMKALGAGDVKMMAMIGAFLGPRPVFIAMLLTFLSGGVMALAVAAWHGSLRKVGSNTFHLLLQSLLRGVNGHMPQVDKPAVATGKLPYAIAIATGTTLYLALAAAGHLGVFA